MNGIKMSDCDFFVNEPEKTVVCVYPKADVRNRRGCAKMVLDFIDENFDFNDLSFTGAINWNGSLEQDLLMPYRFIGKAKCSSDDTWNEELGRKIAFARMKEKCYKSFFKRANLFIQALDRRLNESMEMFNSFGEKLDANRVALNDQINSQLQ